MVHWMLGLGLSVSYGEGVYLIKTFILFLFKDHILHMLEVIVLYMLAEWFMEELIGVLNFRPLFLLLLIVTGWL